MQLLQYKSTEGRVSHEARPKFAEGPQGAFHPHELELCVMEHGDELARVAGTESRLSAGQYGLIPPRCEHSSWTTSRPALETILHIPESRLQDIADQMRVPVPSFVAGEFALVPELATLFESLKTAARHVNDPGHDLVFASLVTALSAVLIRLHTGAVVKAEDGPGTHGLRRAEEMMRANPSESFTLDELASAAGMSRFHFLRSFRKRYGAPPHAWLISLRVELASDLVRRTDLPLTRIAVDLGFGSASRLTEAFRRVHGVPPSHWRAVDEQFSEGRTAIAV